MRDIRRNTSHCGYCGHQEAAAKGLVFCDQCYSSPYLKESDLYLLRMKNFEYEGAGADRPPLTEREEEMQTQYYVQGQTLCREIDAKKKRADLLDKFDTALAVANDEFHGFTWLLDNGVNTENCIFYSHTGRFGFGWRSPVSVFVYNELVQVLCEFPYDYDIKCEKDMSRNV